MLGTIAGVAAPAAAGLPGKIAGPVAKPFAEDIPGIGSFAGTREAMAAEQLRKAATEPDVIDRALNPGPVQPGVEPNPQIVPGSQPTLGQLTGDLGVLRAEKQAETTDNSAFNARKGKQNEAQLAALRGAAPADADTMKPSEAFQSHLANIDQSTDAAVDHLTSRAQDLAAQLGPGTTPEAAGTAIRNGIETARGEAKAARWALYDAGDP